MYRKLMGLPGKLAATRTTSEECADRLMALEELLRGPNAQSNSAVVAALCCKINDLLPGVRCPWATRRFSTFRTTATPAFNRTVTRRTRLVVEGWGHPENIALWVLLETLLKIERRIRPLAMLEQTMMTIGWVAGGGLERLVLSRIQRMRDETLDLLARTWWFAFLNPSKPS